MTYKINNDMLFKAINKWEATAPIEILLDIQALKDHMISKNGIKFNSWIGMTDPEVVDEKKYVMFLLRYA